ncbi:MULTISPECIES: hypothetical protein [Flavobacteriaceae]|uniref:hypothetical protein n=1 Tax=Flavobacteriaceae TaxID=49546 RepID=UPI0014910A05|nr:MULTISPECIES: hypothetical protein [Allomuricauda]MDC6366676.1 hypothetical protein [Muricauda sp. AC10]
MVFTKLTEEHLPSFIYLIDTIKDERYDFNYKVISDVEGKNKEMVVPRSIERAFEFREQLKNGWSGKRPSCPSKKTLNVLTAFVEDSSDLSFLDFAITYKKEIEEHYINNKLDKQLINLLFGKKQSAVSKRIAEMEDKKEAITDVLEDFSLEDFKKVLGPKAREQLKLLFEEWKSEELEPFFENLIQKQLKSWEDKLTTSKKLYGRLGAFSLLLLPKDNGFLFEEDLFAAVQDYQMTLVDGEEVGESILETISEFSG